MAEDSTASDRKRSFRWTLAMIEDFLWCMLNYKTHGK